MFLCLERSCGWFRTLSAALGNSCGILNSEMPALLDVKMLVDTKIAYSRELFESIDLDITIKCLFR